MIEAFAGLLALIIVSAVLQDRFKIPSPITLISSVLVMKICGWQLFPINDRTFDALVILAFPLLIAADAMKLKWADVREEWFSLVWVAGVALLFSVGAGVLLNYFNFLNVPLPVAAVAVLFATISATDPVTVSAVLGNFKVPHKLKLLVEGESLFNDATAIIVFSIALIAMTSTDSITTEFVGQKIIAVFCGAFVIGALCGMLSFTLLRMTEDPLIEASIMIITAYAAYMVAELFHFSGILAIIVSILMCSEKIRRILDEGGSNDKTFMDDYGLLRHQVTTEDNLKFVQKIFEFSAMFAASALFVAIAAIVEFNDVIRYWREILIVFAASTAIRAVMMLKFAVVSHRTSMVKTKVSPHWWAVLTFAGSKGALSVLLVHMIPDAFEHKQMFETIVVGNIVLSTFVYAGILAVVIPLNRKKFDRELAEEEATHAH